MCFFAVLEKELEAKDWELCCSDDDDDIWADDIWVDDIWADDIWADDIWADGIELTTDDPVPTIPLCTQDVVGETTRVSDFVVLVLIINKFRIKIILVHNYVTA